MLAEPVDSKEQLCTYSKDIAPEINKEFCSVQWPRQILYAPKEDKLVSPLRPVVEISSASWTPASTHQEIEIEQPL